MLTFAFCRHQPVLARLANWEGIKKVGIPLLQCLFVLNLICLYSIYMILKLISASSSFSKIDRFHALLISFCSFLICIKIDNLQAAFVSLIMRFPAWQEPCWLLRKRWWLELEGSPFWLPLIPVIRGVVYVVLGLFLFSRARMYSQNYGVSVCNVHGVLFL
jgi:hypothetical protein